MTEVKQRPRDGRDRHAGPNGPVLGMQSARQVNRNAGMAVPSPTGSRHIDSKRRCGPELPQGRRMPMAQQSPWPSCHHGSHPMSLAWYSTVAHGEGAGKEAVKATSIQAALDRPVAQACGDELST